MLKRPLTVKSGLNLLFDMKVETPKLVKEILRDPEARKQLQAALVNPNLVIDFKGKTYRLESIR
jgi:hypothetical protein